MRPSQFLRTGVRPEAAQPTFPFVQRVIGYFNIIWDEAEELFSTAGRSDPRVVVDTSGMKPEYTAFANDLAKLIRQLSPDVIRDMQDILDSAKKRP